MTSPLDTLLSRLDLEQIELNLFRARGPNEGWQRVYGGQVIGQALVAASRTVAEEPRMAHSLHAYFLRPGAMDTPIVYDVDRIRDGKSFTTRRVLAIQKGEPIFSMMVSFQARETGFEHQFPMPQVPAPEDCISEEEHWRAISQDAPAGFSSPPDRKRPIEMRFVDPVNEFKPVRKPPEQHVWLRVTEAMPDDVRLHQCMLAYASDMTLLDTALRPHAVSWNDQHIQVASLDHAMWFHQPMRADQWFLYVQDSPIADNARGFTRGLIFDRSGTLVASVAQEGLFRGAHRS